MSGGRVRLWLAAGATVVAVAAAVVLAWFVVGGGEARPAAAEEGVTVEVTGDPAATGDSAAGHEGCLLLADSGEERRRGLMEVTDLRGFDGMVFVFPEEQMLAFWMRNTPMPLSIAFYDRAGGFVSSADMAPCGDREDCPLTSSAGPARYAVEVPQGMLPSLGMVPGSRLRLGDPCRP